MLTQLTHETMSEFEEALRSLLRGARFTLLDLRGHSHRGIDSLTNIRVETRPDGLKMLNLDLGGVVQPFTSYFKDTQSEPLVSDIQTVRVDYEFTPYELTVFVRYLSPEVNSNGLIRITVG